MGKTRKDKTVELEKLRDRANKMTVALLTYQTALPVNEETKLRRSVRAAQGEYMVTKKTLLSLALKEKGYDTAPLEGLDRPFGISFGYGEESEVARAIAAFRRDHETVEFAGGLLQGRFLSAAEAKALATMPTRLELLGRLVGSVQSPIAGFANVLRGNLSGLCTALSALRDQRAATS